MPLQEIYSYFSSYDKKVYDVFAQQGVEPSMADIAAFETRIGFRLPDEFREFAVHPLGGLYMEVKEELWPRPRPLDVGPFWTFLYGFKVYGLSTKAPDWIQMDPAWRRMADSGFPQCIPFLKIECDSDPYCFTPEGKIIVWRHETPTEPDEISKSFSEVVMFEIRELEERARRKVTGGTAA
jgi:hypothetical protein